MGGFVAVTAIAAAAAVAGVGGESRTKTSSQPARPRVRPRLIAVTDWNASHIVEWLRSSAALELNGTAAAELELHGYMLFDGGLDNETLAQIGITDEESLGQYLEAVSALDARVTKSPRNFFEWRAANRRVCDYWLAPLTTWSPRVMLMWLWFFEPEQRGGAYDKMEDDVADNKSTAEIVATVVFLPHFPIFSVSRRFHSQNLQGSILQYTALLRLCDDIGVAVTPSHYRNNARRILCEELFGVAIAFVGYYLAWSISPTCAFDVLMKVYMCLFPGLLARRIYCWLRTVVVEQPGREFSGSGGDEVASNSYVNPVSHVFKVPGRMASKLERMISADWVQTLACVVVVVLALRALWNATDHDNDGDLDYSDLVAQLDFDSDGDLDFMDMIDMVDQDGDKEVGWFDAIYALGKGASWGSCLAGIMWAMTLIFGIELGRQNVQNKALQMDIQEKDILYDEDRVVMGRGTFGEVYRTRQQPFGGWRGATVAVKRLLGGDGKDMEALKGELKAEALMLALMRHPNIVAFYGVCLDSAEGPLLLTELMEGGSLHDRLYKIDNELDPLTHMQKRMVTRDIAAGLLYLHGKDVAHLDLKPHNVLLTRPPLKAKLCDFGLTRVTRSSIFNIPKMRPGGTPLYMSPEQHTGGFNVTTKSDIYSFAVLLNELETFSLPWIDELSIPPGEPNSGTWIMNEVKRRIKNGERPTLCSGELVGAIITACWAGFADKRPNMREVMYGRGDVEGADGNIVAGWKGYVHIMGLELDERRHDGLPEVADKQKDAARVNYNAIFDLDGADEPRVRMAVTRSLSLPNSYGNSRGAAASMR